MDKKMRNFSVIFQQFQKSQEIIIIDEIKFENRIQEENNNQSQSMNKQYLRSLQERAQRLLEISSDEGSQQQALHLQKTQSRRVDLNEVLSYGDLNEMKVEFEDYRNTDVELLKKCINMTNENSELKRQLKSYQTEINQLKSQNISLQKELYNSRFQLSNKRSKQSTKTNNITNSPYNRLTTHPDNSSQLPSTEQHRQKTSSSHNMVPFKPILIEQQSRRLYNEEIRRLEQRHRREVNELEQRLRVASQKREQLERVMVKEREKCRRLFRFINQEVPGMKDVVTGLTNKVEMQVEALLLRDINQNYEHDMNQNSNNNHHYHHHHHRYHQHQHQRHKKSY